MKHTRVLRILSIILTVTLAMQIPIIALAEDEGNVSIKNNDILYGGHTNPCFDRSLAKNMKGYCIYIVRVGGGR